MFGEKSQYLVILTVFAALVILDIRFNFSNDLGCSTTRATPPARTAMLTTSSTSPTSEQQSHAPSCSSPGKSRSGKTVTRFFVQLLNTKLVAEQLRNLRHFVSDAFEYHVIDGATDPKTKAQIKALADGACVFYHNCPDTSLAHCLNFATQRVISKFTDGFAIHLNVDMFLLKPWSTAAHFARHSNPAVMAVIEDHGHNGGQPVLGYLHPNLLMINTNVANAQLAHMRFDAEAGTDTGGATRAFMQKHPELKLMPLMWSRHFDVRALHAVGLISAEVETMMLHEQETRGIMAADLYASDFSWFHLRDSTCWSGSAACVARSKQLETHVWPVLNAQLTGRKLTYLPLAYDQQWWQRLNHFHQGSCTSGEPMTPGRGDVSPEGFLIEFPPGACLANLEEQARYACFIKKNILIPKGAPIIATTAAVPSQRATTKPKYGFNSEAWMGELYRAVDAMRVKVRAKIASIQASGRKLPLPTPQSPPARTNLHLRPIRYAQPQFARDSSYYWRYVYDGSPGQDLPAPEGVCTKKPGQKYWGLTFAIGPVRQKIGREHTVPSCLHNGVDEMVMMTEEDFDEDFKSRNKETLAMDKGKGLWIWKHFAEWKMLEKMKEGDVLLYIDSDFRCTAEIKQYFCLAHSHNVVGFHHSNAAYKLSRLASRDAMILMDLDSAAVADSVQASGGNILFRKSQFTVDFVKEMASYSQQHEIASGVGRDSHFGDNWPQYTAEKLHQCDQAISSLMLIKHKLKTFPWSADGYGAGSDDDLNLAQRAEAGLTRTSVGIHVRDDMKVAWTADQYS